MALADDIYAAVMEAIEKLGVQTAAGTVVTAPSQVTTDPLTVVLDGSALAVPATQFRGFPLVAGMRVGLVKVRTDWVVIGAFTNPGAGSTMRIVLGADTPAELMAFNVQVALLFYVPDFDSGLEMGYFFIGLSNTLDLDKQKALLFGSVMYPTPGDPSTATTAQVKTHFQMNLGHPGAKFTVFKDAPIQLNASVGTFRSQTPFFIVEKTTAGPGQTFFLNHTVVFGSDTDPADATEVQFLNDVKAPSDTLDGFTYSLGRGIVNYNTSGAVSPGIAANASQVLFTLTHRFKGGRAYRVELLGAVAGPTNGRVGFTIRNGTLATGTLIADYGWFDTTPDATAAAAMNANAGVYLYRDALPGDIDKQINLTMLAGTAAGTYTHVANATLPRGLVIYDVGDAADYLWAVGI